MKLKSKARENAGYQVEVTRANKNPGLTRGKTRVTKSWLLLVLDLIGWWRGASFLNQSRSEEEQNPELLSTLN